MLTFTTVAETTVTFDPAAFAAEAAEWVRHTGIYLAAAEANLAAAKALAPTLPADWHTPGGANVEYVLHVMEADVDSVRQDHEDATRHAARAATATTATAAARAAEYARVCAAHARHDADTTTRYLGYITN